MMRGFSRSPHRVLMAAAQAAWVEPVRIPRLDLAVLVVLVLGAGIALGGVAASLRGPQAAATPTPLAVTASPAPSPSLAAVDMPGEDIARLPRYPGSVRSAHEVIGDGGFRVTANEYRADASVDDVRAFYQRVIVDHGWERADIGFDHGEWSYVLVDGSVEALIEIEELGGIVEIDLQVSEPIATQTPAPATPVPTIAPAAPPPPPPARPDDDDDGDDDDGGTDDD